MSWTRCIEINREDLLPTVAQILAMLGDSEVLLRHMHLAILALLRPAESTLRRLIEIAAKDIVVKPRAKRSPPSGKIPKGSGGRKPVFVLMDPRREVGPPKQKKAPGFGPNVRGFDDLDVSPPSRVEITRDDPVSAAALRRRIEALVAAMNDIPGQAKRLARKQAGMERPLRVMRPGRPPGHVERGKRPIDLLLREVHELALMALAGMKAPP